jgi:hypothetical protein
MNVVLVNLLENLFVNLRACSLLNLDIDILAERADFLPQRVKGWLQVVDALDCH